NRDSFGDGRQGCAGDRRVRVRTAERVEVTFRSPDGLESVLIEILRAVQHQTVLVTARCVIIAPHEETEANWAILIPGRCREVVLNVTLDHDLETAGKSPEQLEDRDVE